MGSEEIVEGKIIHEYNQYNQMFTNASIARCAVYIKKKKREKGKSPILSLQSVDKTGNVQKECIM